MSNMQADDIVQAMHAPDAAHQAALQARRDEEARQLVRGRRVSATALVTMGVGALMAYLTGYSISQGVLAGGLLGGALAWWVLEWRAGRQ